MWKFKLLSLFGLLSFAAFALAGSAPSTCEQLRHFKDDFDHTAQNNVVTTWVGFDEETSTHDQRHALAQYISYLGEQASNVAALAYALHGSDTGDKAPQVDAKLQKMITKLREKSAELDSDDSDLPLTVEESELGHEAAHISSVLEQLRGSVRGDIARKCRGQGLVARQSLQVGGTVGAVGGTVGGAVGAVGGAVENVGNTVQGVAGGDEATDLLDDLDNIDDIEELRRRGEEALDIENAILRRTILDALERRARQIRPNLFEDDSSGELVGGQNILGLRSLVDGLLGLLNNLLDTP